jgi:RHS repeat-associated protein
VPPANRSALDASAKVVLGLRQRSGPFQNYDELNRLTEVHEGGGDVLARYTYDPLSRRTRVSYGNGAAIDYRYHADNSVSVITNYFAGGTAAFHYEQNGLGQLSSVSLSDPAFRYNPLGATNVSYTANPLNQYVTVGGKEWTNDLNGNLLGQAPNRYLFDTGNRLVAVTSAVHQVTYSYNALGQRTRMTVDGASRFFVWDGFQVLAEYDSRGNLTKRYLYGRGLDDLILMQTPSGRFYYHQDRSRSVVAISGASGNVAERYAYCPYGQPDRLSSLGNTRLFTGAEYDAATGFYYFRARYYSPAAGRFLSPDPIRYAGDGLNLYAYARNNPVAYVDPLGLSSSWWNWSSQIGGDYNYLDALATGYAKIGRTREACELAVLNQALREYGEARDQAEGGKWWTSGAWSQPDCTSTYPYFTKQDYKAIYDGVKSKLTKWKVLEVSLGDTDDAGFYKPAHQGLGLKDLKTGKIVAVFDPVVTYWGGQWAWNRYGPASVTSLDDWYIHNMNASKGSEFVAWEDDRVISYDPVPSKKHRSTYR